MAFTSSIVTGNMPVIQEPTQFRFVIQRVVDALLHLVAVCRIVRIQRVDNLEVFVQQRTDLFVPAVFSLIGRQFAEALFQIKNPGQQLEQLVFRHGFPFLFREPGRAFHGGRQCNRPAGMHEAACRSNHIFLFSGKSVIAAECVANHGADIIVKVFPQMVRRSCHLVGKDDDRIDIIAQFAGHVDPHITEPSGFPSVINHLQRGFVILDIAAFLQFLPQPVIYRAKQIQRKIHNPVRHILSGQREILHLQIPFLPVKRDAQNKLLKHN